MCQDPPSILSKYKIVNELTPVIIALKLKDDVALGCLKNVLNPLFDVAKALKCVK